MSALEDHGTYGTLAALAFGLVLVTAGLGATVVSQADNESIEAASGGPAAPQGIHLSWSTPDPSNLTVTWFTDANDVGTVVQYADTCEAIGTSDTQSAATGTTNEIPAVDKIAHSAVMTGLETETTVCYRVGSSAAWSDTYVAKTRPEPGEPFKYVLIGDMGVSDRAVAVQKDIAGDVKQEVRNSEGEVVGHDSIDPDGVDVILHAGDLSYANGDVPVWFEWFEQIERYAKHVPMMSSAGNHEWRDLQGDGSGVPTYEAYTSVLANPGNELYYSFDVGNMHIAVFPSHPSAYNYPTDADDGLLGDTSQGVDFTDMVAFLRNDLEDAAQRRADGEIDFIAVLQHHPLYSNHQSPTRQYDAENVAWEEPLLQAYEVDFLLGGHNHFYERTYPMLGSVPTTTSQGPYEDPVGFIQVTSGAAGQSLYEFQDRCCYPFDASHDRQYHRVIGTTDDGRITMEALSSVFPANLTLDKFEVIRTDQQAQTDPIGDPAPTVDELMRAVPKG